MAQVFRTLVEVTMKKLYRCHEEHATSVVKCLRDIVADKKNVHEGVLVWESTRMPKVQSMTQKFFQGRGAEQVRQPGRGRGLRGRRAGRSPHG